jgi:hypothetical protein
VQKGQEEGQALPPQQSANQMVRPLQQNDQKAPRCVPAGQLESLPPQQAQGLPCMLQYCGEEQLTDGCPPLTDGRTLSPAKSRTARNAGE